MIKSFLFLVFGAYGAVYASISSPIQTEKPVQSNFETAEEKFIPFYTGPLITGSANNVPKGQWDLQPYFYATVKYARFNNHRKSIDMPNIYILNPLLLIQVGVTTWMDFTVIPQCFFKFSQGNRCAHFGDLSAQLGFQILNETPMLPSIRAVLGESFPTGKYQHFKANKQTIDSTGSGNYVTSFGLNLSKIFWWALKHPVALRLSTNYNVQNQNAHVHGFNTYGGGHHTNGFVHVGNALNVDYGVEVSLTQRWVFAMDIAYTYSNKSTFHGKKGNATVNGLPSSDQLSLAPAIEYNLDQNGGFIGGLWFSITGRNRSNFASLVLSYTQLF